MSLLREVRGVFDRVVGPKGALRSPQEWDTFIGALSSNGLLQMGEGEILRRHGPSDSAVPELRFDDCMNAILDAAELVGLVPEGAAAGAPAHGAGPPPPYDDGGAAGVRQRQGEEGEGEEGSSFARSSVLLHECILQARDIRGHHARMVSDAPGGLGVEAAGRFDVELEGLLEVLREARQFAEGECEDAVLGAVRRVSESLGGEACRSLFLDQLDWGSQELVEEAELGDVSPAVFQERNKILIRRILDGNQVGELTYSKDPRRMLDVLPVSLQRFTGFYREPGREIRIRVICIPLCPEDGQDMIQVEHNLVQVEAWKELAMARNVPCFRGIMEYFHPKYLAFYIEDTKGAEVHDLLATYGPMREDRLFRHVCVLLLHTLQDFCQMSRFKAMEDIFPEYLVLLDSGRSLVVWPPSWEPWVPEEHPRGVSVQDHNRFHMLANFASLALHLLGKSTSAETMDRLRRLDGAHELGLSPQLLHILHFCVSERHRPPLGDVDSPLVFALHFSHLLSHSYFRSPSNSSDEDLEEVVTCWNAYLDPGAAARSSPPPVVRRRSGYLSPPTSPPPVQRRDSQWSLNKQSGSPGGRHHAASTSSSSSSSFFSPSGADGTKRVSIVSPGERSHL